MIHLELSAYIYPYSRCDNTTVNLNSEPDQTIQVSFLKERLFLKHFYYKKLHRRRLNIGCKHGATKNNYKRSKRENQLRFRKEELKQKERPTDARQQLSRRLTLDGPSPENK